MRITWVLADSAQLDPTIDLHEIKNIGPFWGGWQTWRTWATDNVICHNSAQARNLVSKEFHLRCNLYLPASAYQELDRPSGVKLYNGDFHQDIDHHDEIVSMHLASTNSDIVLLLGFNMQVRNLEHDKLAKHKWHSYQHYFRQIITDSPSVQWVLLDNDFEINKELKKVPNLQFDTFDNVIAQFNN